MKNIIWIILIALTLFVLLIIRPIRTTSVMKGIAENEFENVSIYDTLRKQLLGPVITDKGKYSEFKWYKVLEWGDTAAVYIDVFKRPNSFSWRDDFFWPRITMNYQWYYFLFPKGTSKFIDILPNQYTNKKISISDFRLYNKQENVADSIKYVIKLDKLFFFLQKGYFQVMDKQENYIAIDFYEPVANIVHKDKNDTILTMSAKVFVNDSLEVLIMPYYVPIEIRNKK